jgi:hypothetical protein
MSRELYAGVTVRRERIHVAHNQVARMIATIATSRRIHPRVLASPA